MTRGLGKCLAIFFAACFFALQFHPIGEYQSDHNEKPIFHIEEISTSVIDKRIDNSFIYVQQRALKHVYLSQQKTKLKQQRQYRAEIERQVKHPYRLFVLKSSRECLSAVCQDYNDKQCVSFNYMQKLNLFFAFNPTLIAHLIQVHIDEPDSKISLS